MTAFRTTSKRAIARLTGVSVCLVAAGVLGVVGQSDLALAAAIVGTSTFAGVLLGGLALRFSPIGGVVGSVVRLVAAAACYLVATSNGLVEEPDLFAVVLISFYVIASWGETWLSVRSISRLSEARTGSGVSAQASI